MTLPRFTYVTALALLVVLATCTPAGAQEDRWKQLDAQASELYRAGKYQQGVPVAQEALRVAEATFGPEDARVANSLNHLGNLYSRQEKYAEAEPLYQRALRIEEKALGPEHPGVAQWINDLAWLYYHQHKYAEAEPLFLRALRIREKVFGSERPEVGWSLNDLGVLYSSQEKYAEAESLLQRALRIYEKVLWREDPEVAVSLDNLAILYQDQGKYAEAEPLYQRALRIREKTLGPEHPGVAWCLNHLAGLYLRQGKYAEAEPLYQRALRIREKVLSPDHFDVAYSLNDLALLYRMEGRYAEAEPLYQRSLRIYERTRSPDDLYLAMVLGNLGQLYTLQGRYGEAEPLEQRGLRIREKVRGPSDVVVAYSLTDLADNYYYQGKYAEAEPLYQRAVRIRENGLGPEDPQLAKSLNNLAVLYFAQALPDQAQPLFTRSFDSLFRQFQYHFTYMTEKDRLNFLATVAYRFPLYFSFVHQFQEKDPQLAGRMYDLLLWEKGFIAGSVTTLRRQVAASGDPEAQKLLDQLSNKRTQISAQLGAQPKDREAWRKQIEQLEAEANDLEHSFVQRSAAFAQQKQLERATWQQVRDALKPGEAAVEFARFHFYDGKRWTDTSYYVALVVTPETKDQPAYAVLDEGKQLEGAPLVQFQQQMQTRGAGSPSAQPGPQAYELFWKPLEPLLAGKSRVYLSPDGIFNQFPLGLIPAPDGKLLMEKYDLRLVSSTKDLLRTPTSPAGNSAVVVGNPNFDLGEAQQRVALAKLQGQEKPEPVLVAALAPTDRSRDQGRGTTLPPLPETAAEVQALAELMNQHKWQITTYTGERALEEAVKQAHGPRVLHLATHGFFLADQKIQTERLGSDLPTGLEDPMLRSGLFFAGANRALSGQTIPEDMDDGVLTAYEAASLNLQGTELVVLSACNTGRGDVKNGEGVFGLRRALQEAGAQSVLMSLWSVPDRETQELMTLFYQKWLAGKEKHQALREAQLEEREVVRKRYGEDLPFYWGAFVLVGR